MSDEGWMMSAAVFVAVTFVLELVGPVAYRAKKGSARIYRTGRRYFLLPALLGSLPVTAAVMVSYLALPIPSIIGYILGGFMTILGCAASGILFQEAIDFLTLTHRPGQESAVESTHRMRERAPGERPKPRRRRRPEEE
jgi:hypothetical protein